MLFPTRRPLRLAAAALLALSTACAPSRAPASRAPELPSAQDIPAIAHERHTLPNGLTLLLSADRSAPIVAVSAWYHVGSKNEKPGRTGFAHLFEHLMFQGSAHVAEEQHVKLIEEAGGRMNGSTSTDRTNYWQVVPANQLETVLWLESDRMGFLLPTLTQAKLDNQRDVVKNERRQRVDNQPFGRRFEVISAAIYPEGHPYSWPVIGSMADLSSASIEDVREFFERYYTPRNATLAIVGDIDLARTRAMVERYFGGIPGGVPVERPVVPATTLSAEKRLVLEDAKARLPQLEIVWPTVGRGHEDAIPLAALSRVLTQDRTSRLTKLLVYERQLATRVSAYAGSDESAGEFYVSIQPRPTASLTEIEQLVDSVVSELRTSPPTEREVGRFRSFLTVEQVTGLQSVLEKAELLNDGQVYFGDPLRYIAATRAALSVTPEDVKRVAERYLTEGRVVLSMVPAGKLELVSRPDRPHVNVTAAGGAS